MLLNSRTDMAGEAYNLFSRDAADTGRLSGVIAEQKILNSMDINYIEITDEKGASALSKPVGKYYSMDIAEKFDRGSDIFSAAASALAEIIKSCLKNKPTSSFFIAALGNPDITPDALGSIAASNIIVSRHLKKSMPDDFSGFSEVSICRTGVLGTTGIESAAQIRALCSAIRPDCVIAVDALAGADFSRLCRCIQVSTGGISPGSGVGNNRPELSLGTLGVPVIAVGVPTVLDASAFSDSDGLSDMFVTPRYIDSSVRAAAKLIAYGINLALHPGLTISDIDMLAG